MGGNFCTLVFRMMGVESREAGEVFLVVVLGAIDELGAVVGEIMALSNIVTSYWRALSWDGVVVNGDFGVGVCRTRVSAMAASVTSSAADVVDIAVLWRKKETVFAILSFFVLVIYTVWYL